MIGIEHYVAVSSILFVLGVLGIFLNRKNVIVILMAIELILLSVNLNLVAFSSFLHDLTGQIFAMFVLTVAAGEAAHAAAAQVGLRLSIAAAPDSAVREHFLTTAAHAAIGRELERLVDEAAG